MDIEVEVQIEECIETIKAKEVDRFDAAVLKIGQIGPPAYELLALAIKRANEFESMYLSNALIALGAPVVPYILRLLPEIGGVTKSYLIAALGEIKSEDGIEAVKKAFDDHDQQVRQAALCAMDKYYSSGMSIGDFENILYKALNDVDIDIRSYAAGILGNLRSGIALDDLMTMTEDAEPTVRAAAARAIGRHRDGKGAEALLKLLKDPMSFVVSAACLALADTGDAAFVPCIGAMLSHKSEFVRLSAIKALGRLRSEKSLTYLGGVREDENEQVRELANKVIKFLNENEVNG